VNSEALDLIVQAAAEIEDYGRILKQTREALWSAGLTDHEIHTHINEIILND